MPKEYQSKPITTQQAVSKMAILCSKKECCEFDIVAKLNTLSLEQTSIDEVIEYLKKENYINTQRYANSFVNDKFKFSKWGRVKIAYALKQKHIPSSAIYSAIDTIDEIEYQQALSQCVEDKRKGLKGKTPQQAQASLYNFAVSRGYEPQLVLKAIKG